MFDFDPRDRDHDVRDIEMPWIESGPRPRLDREQDDCRELDDVRDRDPHGTGIEPDPVAEKGKLDLGGFGFCRFCWEIRADRWAVSLGAALFLRKVSRIFQVS